MKLIREIIGYLLGGVVFVVGMPALMWLLSGTPALWPVGAARLYAACLLAAAGLALSVWAIVYMRRKGDGNPMDAFGHEVAPRTKHLMTDGPYRLSRNPMLTGIFAYLAGCGLWLWTWQAAAFFVAFAAIMLLQVRSEEKRLRRDFGDEYTAYCRCTGRFFPKRK
ncbi:MAG: isoprenylcysteine carboxylmethyltransferase family protein [Bacteroidales bacterium]|nr:isoprenylcysteine carboxylmethyltransferase family protein [Bacteroidales bacterium]